MPLMSGFLNSALWASRPCRITASSSAVRTGSVAMRQCSITSSPSNTPSTVLVLPTSMVSSMTLLQRSPAGSGPAGQHYLCVIDEPGRPDPGRDQEQRGTVLAVTGRGERDRVHQRPVVEHERRVGRPRPVGAPPPPRPHPPRPAPGPRPPPPALPPPPPPAAP